MDDKVAEATSPVRDKLGGILTRLNILSSRIDFMMTIQTTGGLSSVGIVVESRPGYMINPG